MEEQKHEYKYLKTKKLFDELWTTNNRYKSWQKRDEHRKVISISFGFKKVMGNRRGYWMYDIPNDFDIIPLHPALIESVEPLTNMLRRHLIEIYGEEYADALKHHLHEKGIEDYNEQAEKIDKWLAEAKLKKETESE